MAADPNEDGAARMAIPNTLHDSLVARLDRLGPVKPVASLGAAIGRRFSYELLAAVSTSARGGAAAGSARTHQVGPGRTQRAPPQQPLSVQARADPRRGLRVAAEAGARGAARPDRRRAARPVPRDRGRPSRRWWPTTSPKAARSPKRSRCGWKPASSAAVAGGARGGGLSPADRSRPAPPAAGRRRARRTGVALLLGLAASLAASRGFSVPEVGGAPGRGARDLRRASAMSPACSPCSATSAISPSSPGQLDAAEETARRCLQHRRARPGLRDIPRRGGSRCSAISCG